MPVEVVAIPPRREDAPGGTAFAEAVGDLPGPERIALAVSEILSGNVPEALRTWWPVVLRGGGHEVVAWVSPRYLQIGDDEDALAVPLDYPSAAEIALAWGCGLPTPRLVDATFEQALVRAAPSPLPAGPEMEGVGYVLRHHELVRKALPDEVAPGIVAGTHKDLVITGRLFPRPAREAIYGWHQPDGEPIQPLSVWHRATYADYSHGLRLVFGEVLADGVPIALWDALADPVYGALLSDEGPIGDARAILVRSIERQRAGP